MRDHLVQVAYLVAAVLFIFSLHWMNHPRSARRGVFAGIAGMALAILGTLLLPGISNWDWILAVAVVLGFLVGVPLSRVPLTAVPQRTALSHAFGGLAAGLVGTAKYYLWLGEPREPHAVPHVGDRRRGDPRLPHLHRQPDGRRQAAGAQLDPQRPVTYRGQNLMQPGRCSPSPCCAAWLLVAAAGRARHAVPGDDRVWRWRSACC